MLVGTLSGVGRRWYPSVQELHRFFTAISRTVVNNDGSAGTDPDLRIWSAGALPKRRRIVDAVRKFALLPGLAPIWDSRSITVLPTAVNA